MSGDLSLSQSLGGLRIANPDDETIQSPTSPVSPTSEVPLQRPPPPSSHSSGSTIREQSRPRGISTISQGEPERDQPSSTLPTPTTSQPSPQDPTAGPDDYRLNYHRSIPPGYTAQQQMQYPPQPSQYAPSIRAPSVPGTTSRPVSGLYNHTNTSNSSQGSYRYRDDYQPQPPAGVTRSTSRSAAMALGGGYPSREASRNERAFRQSQQIAPENGVMPPRRSSKRIPSGGSPYGAEGGPVPSSEEWKERGAAVSTRQEMDSNGRPVSKVVKKGVKDFNFGRTLGEGSYSTVLAATDRQTLREYAIKVLDKRHIIKEKKVKYVNIEKDTLNRLTDHPGIVRLYYTFQDERSLYFVLDLASGGELLGTLKKMGTFDEECTRFYGAQILDSIAYMHSRGIIHRDLKPENVLLDDKMHTKITDFGTAKILGLNGGQDGSRPAGDPMDGAETDRAVSFVGTAEYVSPELLTDKNACKASDLWAFGCIIYQLLAGRPPFKAANEYLTFQKIVALDYTFPDGFPEVARDLIERLLVLDPAKRLPIDHIKNHQFFDGIIWGKGLWKQKAPRLRSYVPPTAKPISLNDQSAPYPPNIPSSMSQTSSHQQPHLQSQQSVTRPQLRAITELPPPSQLDIDWSPVLTRNNERIMKLGNLMVTSSATPLSPTSRNGEAPAETPRKLSRFFGGGATKKKNRLVMITSSARVIIAAAGGDEKKAKVEISLLASTTSYKSYQDSKGLTAWSVDTRDKHYTFEDPRATTSDPAGSKFYTQEWMESIEQAKEIAMSQSLANSYSGDSQYNDIGSGLSSPASTIGADGTMEQSHAHGSHSGRQTLRKEPGDSDSIRTKRSRFSKRHSKSGLAAVF